MDVLGDLPFELSPEDRRVVDELVEAGFSRRAVEAMPSSDRRRAEKLLAMLGLLHDYPVEDGDETLVRLTLERVEQARDGGASGDLSPDDQRVVDALAESGFDPEVLEGMSAQDRPRAESVLSLLSLLDAYPVEEGDETLVHATLAGIDRYEAERGTRMKLDPADEKVLRGRGARRIPLPNFISVAAVILIGASVVLPIMHGLRQQQLEMRSLSNLRYVTHAVDNYASDNGGTVPTARAGLSQSLWSAFTDAINLTPMVEQDYCRLNSPQPSEPQRVLTADWWQSNMILFIGDRNPFIEAIREGRFDAPITVTLRQGQPRRSMLTRDAAILWLQQPRFTQERSLWRPRGMMWMKEEIHPDEPER